ncbi:hypothetical protein V1478_013941 [Vespula squamosa]|uniref:Uncharacterized protein n=1 Tax=Vespula squamosa TaxID=30214 RepID=A0ABD2A6R0_VESSQ
MINWILSHCFKVDNLFPTENIIDLIVSTQLRKIVAFRFFYTLYSTSKQILSKLALPKPRLPFDALNFGSYLANTKFVFYNPLKSDSIYLLNDMDNLKSPFLFVPRELRGRGFQGKYIAEMSTYSVLKLWNDVMDDAREQEGWLFGLPSQVSTHTNINHEIEYNENTFAIFMKKEKRKKLSNRVENIAYIRTCEVAVLKSYGWSRCCINISLGTTTEIKARCSFLRLTGQAKSSRVDSVFCSSLGQEMDVLRGESDLEQFTINIAILTKGTPQLVVVSTLLLLCELEGTELESAVAVMDSKLGKLLASLLTRLPECICVLFRYPGFSFNQNTSVLITLVHANCKTLETDSTHLIHSLAKLE